MHADSRVIHAQGESLVLDTKHTRARTHAHTHTFTQTHARTYRSHTHIVHTYTRIVHTHTHTQTHTHTHTHTHIYIVHTHTHTLSIFFVLEATLPKNCFSRPKNPYLRWPNTTRWTACIRRAAGFSSAWRTVINDLKSAFENSMSRPCFFFFSEAEARKWRYKSAVYPEPTPG